jgi:hypothetical protein
MMRRLDVRLRCTTALMFCLSVGGASGASTPADEQQIMGITQQAARPVSEFLALRGQAFEELRKLYFGDQQLMLALRASSQSPDEVEAFLAKTLVRWATEMPPSVSVIEQFIRTEAPTRTQNNRSAGSARNEVALLRLASQQKDPQFALDYLMLLALIHPSMSELPLQALGALYAQRPTKEPATWLRIAVEDGSDSVATYFAEQSLPKIAPAVVRRALQAERSRLMRIGKELPAALEQYRVKLTGKL